jgi:hypothetical protein
MSDLLVGHQAWDPLASGHYGGGDGSVFMQLLGPIPGVGGSTNSYEGRAVETWNLPKGVERQSLILQDTIIDMIMTADQDFWRTVFPTVLTESLQVETEEWTMLSHMMRPTPYQAPGELLQSENSKKTGNLVNYNIMAQFESRFLKTVRGRAMFMATLRQMENSALETMNALIMRAIVLCHVPQNNFMRQNRPITVKQFIQYFDTEITRCFIAQKTKNGLAKLDADINKEVQAIGGKTDTWLVPEDVIIHQTFVPSESTDYDKAGYRGPDRINNGPGGRKAGGGSNGNLDRVEPAHFIESAQVFVVKSRRVDNIPIEEQTPFTRCRQIGNFVRMTHDDCDAFGDEYQSINRSILVFDEDIDDMRVIRLEHAIDNCGLFDAVGNVADVNFTKGMEFVDLEQDFMTYKDQASGEYRTCEWLFQLNPKHLSTRHIIRGAETLAAAIRRTGGDPTEITANTLKPIFGSQPLFFGDDFDGWTTTGNLRDADRPNAATRAPFATEEARIANAMLAAVQSKIHESKKADVNAIIGSSLSVLEKAEQLKEKMLESVDAKLVEGFRDTPHALGWYKNLVDRYQSKVAEVRANAPAVEEVGRSSDTGSVPTHSSEFAAVRNAPQQQQQQDPQQQRRLQSGGGMGLADIGSFDWAQGRNPTEYRSNVKSALERKVAMASGFNEHLAALESAGLSETSGLKKLALIYLQLSTNKQTMLALARHHIVVPMNFLLFSPHQQYTTNTVAKLQSNGGAGNLYMGNSNFTRGGDVGTMTQTLHFSTHMLAHVHNPRNIYVQPDVRSAAYEGGGGTKFYTPELYAQYNPDDLQRSLICVAVPITENDFGYNNKYMDISGRFYANNSTNLMIGSPSDSLHYSTAPRYNSLYGFVTPSGIGRGSDEPSILFARNHVNRLVVQGHQQNYNSATRTYNRVTINQGHWGKNVYAGVGRLRNGARDQIAEQNYAASGVPVN